MSGIWVKEMFVPVTPLSAPATKVTISNVPPFVSNEAILKELQRFGKIASPVKTLRSSQPRFEMHGQEGRTFFCMRV